MDVDSDLEDTIRQQVDEWSSNSNDCFTVDLVRGDGTVSASFNPAFTYPMFGDEEAIFGYQDLDIRLSFAAHHLRPHLSVNYSKKFQTQGEVEPTDIQAALKDFLSESAFTKAGRDKALMDSKAAEFVPPGKKIHQYTRSGQKFEIWCASLADPAAKTLLENMQLLVPMFIEGGTILQLEHDWSTQRWKLFLIYQVDSSDTSPSSSPYSLVGYGTSYRVFTFPDRQKPEKTDVDIFSPGTQSIEDFLPPPTTDENTIPNLLAPTAMPNDISSPLDLPSRERLSQFLILPPFQSAGHGRELYNTMYSSLIAGPNIREFTVEDPNEAFDDLRDLCDLLHLRASEPTFAALRINPDVPTSLLKNSERIPTDEIVPLETREALLRSTKIMQRQFDRLVEMHTLSFIPAANRSRSRITKKEKASNPNDRAYYFWRLYAKQRLYVFNRDTLAQLEREERVEKLEAALDAVQEAYGELLEKAADVAERFGVANGKGVEIEGDGEVGGSARKKVRGGKRKVVDDGDEDEDDDSAAGAEKVGKGDGAEAPVNGHKKVRVA